MAWQLVCDGFAWQLAEDVDPDRLRQEIETAMNRKGPLTVALLGKAILILNFERLAHAVIFDAGDVDARTSAPMERDDRIMHVQPPP